jgi:hypothetical protein
MSQLGMQMPGRKRTRAATPNVYTGILLGAVGALIGAIAIVWIAGMQVGPGEGPMSALSIHPDSGRLDLAE